VEVLFAGEDNFTFMEPLEAMLQHWAVGFFQDILSNFNDIVGPDADDISIECGVVEFAEG
jgi:hypothetical protein